MTPAPPQHSAWRNGRIAWWTAGPHGAPWIVFCHGMALDHRDLLPMAESLAREWRVLLWDMPGHGASRPYVGDWTVDTMTDALAIVLEAAGVEDPVVVGFSFGGVVAQSLLRRRETRVRGLVAYACYAPYLRGPLLPRGLVRPVVALRYGWRAWPAIQRAFAAECVATTAPRAALAAAMDAVGKPGFLALARALLGAGPRDASFELDCPVLAVSGALDPNGAPLVHALDALAAASASGRRVSIAGAGHCAHLDAPDAMLDALRRFLLQLAAKPQPASRSVPAAYWSDR